MSSKDTRFSLHWIIKNLKFCYWKSYPQAWTLPVQLVR